MSARPHRTKSVSLENTRLVLYLKVQNQSILFFSSPILANSVHSGRIKDTKGLFSLSAKLCKLSLVIYTFRACNSRRVNLLLTKSTFENAFLDVIKGRCSCVIVLSKYLGVKASCAQSSRILILMLTCGGRLSTVNNAAMAGQVQDLTSILLFTLVFVRRGLIKNWMRL